MNNSLDLMRARLNVRGGALQQDRMIKDKRENLDKVILYSYQGAKVRKLGSESSDPALINPNTVKQDYDDKIISIGFEYDYKPGTIFDWVNTGTKWLIYLQDLTELAYFKGDIRKCSYEIKWKGTDGEVKSTYAAVKGPSEKNISSTVASGISVDSPNYSLNLLLPLNEDTLAQFTRYSEFYLSNICWRVEAIDMISTPGILEVNAVEYFKNEQTDNVEEGIVEGLIVEEIPEPSAATIEGEIFIKPKRSYTYKYTGINTGSWNYDKNLPLEVEVNDKEITLKWTKTYTGQFVIEYAGEEKTIVVESLF